MSGSNFVRVRLNPEKLCQVYGLGPSGSGRKFLAQQVRQRSDKYVPKDTGNLKNSAVVSPSGETITYPTGYAGIQFYRNYRHIDPNRGPQWHQRMLQREGDALTAEVETYLKRRPR